MIQMYSRKRNTKDQHDGRGRSEHSSKRCSLGILILLVTFSALTIPASAAESPSVMVKGYSITPTVLMPGEEALLTVTIRGTASSTQTDSVSTDSAASASTSTSSTSSTVTTLVPYIESVTFHSSSVVALNGASQFKGPIGPDQEIPISFLIRAPDRSGIYFPEIWIRARDGQSLRYPVPVNVNTPISSVKLPSITLDNDFIDYVKPGTRAVADVTVANAGSSRADNIQVSIDGNPPEVIPAGISTIWIESLDQGHSVSRAVALLIDKNAGTGLLQVPVTITYALADGTEVTRNSSIGLDVRGEAEIAVTSVETIPTRAEPGMPFDLIIRVQNTGTGDARSVSASIDLPMGGATEAFVGRIKSGSDAPAAFILQGAEPGTYPYRATIEWVDDWGAHTVEKDLTLTVASSGGIDLLLLIVPIAGVIAAAGFLFYRRRRGEG